MSDELKTLGDYSNYEFGEIRRSHPQMNMQIATVEAIKKVLFDKTDEKEHVIFICVNNNTQFETIIPKSAWCDINKGIVKP